MNEIKYMSPSNLQKYDEKIKEYIKNNSTYDDTAISNRIETIEDDYLTSTDKTELTSAIATAKTQAIETVLGEGVSTDFDTLKEIADWIQSDTTDSAKLVTRVTDVEKDIDTLQTNIANKVDKVSGKGLSTNDYTTAEKTKLSGIATGAEVNVQSDWNVTDTASDAYIKNKPTTATTSAAGLMSAADKSKLDAITASADAVSVTQKLTSGTEIGTITVNGTGTKLYAPTSTSTDTKNTAGSTDSSSKLFLIGATSQAANPQTYSHNTVYVETNGHLYSNSKQVVNLSDSQALTNKTYNGYTLGAACAKGVDTTPADKSTNLITSGGVYTSLASYAVKSHASSTTSFGKGSTGGYGHLKISDDYSVSPNTNYNASAGVAASLYSVQKVYEELKNSSAVSNSTLTVSFYYADKISNGISWSSGPSSTFEIIDNVNGGSYTDSLCPGAKKVDYICFTALKSHKITITNNTNQHLYFAKASSSSQIASSSNLNNLTTVLSVNSGSSSSGTFTPSDTNSCYIFYSGKTGNTCTTGSANITLATE